MFGVCGADSSFAIEPKMLGANRFDFANIDTKSEAVSVNEKKCVLLMGKWVGKR